MWAPIGVLLLLSGTAGLIYQVAWVRLLGLAFGVTVYAISTVLAAFMAGLAIGSVVGGPRADAVRRPLLGYGLIELGVGLTALLTPIAFHRLQDVYAGLAQVVDPAQAPLLAGAARAVLAFAVLLVPTTLMGATLPLAVRAARRMRVDLDATRGDARAMGVLYGINTFGAIVGCLLSGFVLIGRFGLAETIASAAACNVVAGLAAVLLSVWDRRQPKRAALASSSDGRHGSTHHTLAGAAFWTFAVSGAISLAYEVVWSRILAILFDSSIYGFVLMLATVLLGIAVGGALGGVLVGWRPSTRVAGLLLGGVEIGIGLCAILALVAFGGAYDMLLGLRETPLARLVRTDTRLMAALCVVTVLPAALLMGATFPLAARLWAAGSDRLGRRLGGIYGANVAGAIVGSLAGGFVLVPLLGAHLGLLVLAAANVAVGTVLLVVVTRAWWPLVGGTAALVLVGWGATRPPLHAVVFAQHFPDQDLVAYWEGLENTVSVGRAADGVQTLFTNSRGQTNDAPDLVRYHRVMGHLAALLAPGSAPRALVVGLGAGATPGAIARHSGAQVDVVELSGAVIAAAPLFSVANDGVLKQPNVHLSIDDGRNFLLRNHVSYDVVTADVVHPYDAGATNLYSVEYFSLVARSLKPNGIMVQWVSPGGAFEHSLIVRTFLCAFPHASLWLGGDLLIGSRSPLVLSRAQLEQRLADPRARSALSDVGFNHAQDVLAQFRADDPSLRQYAGPGPILTDDHPLLEYFLALDAGQEPLDVSQFQDVAPTIT
jgi:spermidine synthase